MKITELSNKDLDRLVALSQGWERIPKSLEFPNGKAVWATLENGLVKTSECNYEDYHPTSNWEQAGELIEKFKIDVIHLDTEDAWHCILNGDLSDTADTAQRAICLAVVASVYGEEVDDEKPA